MSDTELPAGWASPSIGALFKVVGGGTPSTKEPQYWGDGNPWITSADIDSSGQIQMLRDVTRIGVENSTTNVVPPRTVLVVTRVGLGKVAIAAQEICFSQDVQGLLPLNEVDSEYCLHFLSHEMQRLKFDGRGTTISGITKKQLTDAEFPLPPLAEQMRIVAKIEELFAKLDKGIESLRDAQARLKLYRYASIDSALRNLEGLEASPTRLGDVIGTIDQGWSPKCDYNLAPEENQWAVITTTAVQPQKYLPLECKPLPANLDPRPGIEIQPGDILMTRKGPRKRTGVVCRVRDHRPRSMLCDTVYRFRADETIISPNFLEVLLNSPSVLAQIDRLKAGISDSGISLNQEKVKSVELTFPRDIEAQRRIYKRVQTIEDSIVRVESEIATQLAKAEALRRSILRRAFSGKLVPQDPNDEPASVLLERIRAERAADKPPKRQPRMRKAKAKA